MKPRNFYLILLFLIFHPSDCQDLNKIDSLVTILSEQSQDSSRTRLMFELAIELSTTDTVIAIDYLNNARQLADKMGDTGGLGRYFKILGKMNTYHGHYRKGILNYERAMAYFSEADDDISYFETLKDKGNIYLYLSEYTQAMNHYSSALDFYKRNNMKIGMSRCLNNMGIIYKNKGEYSEALLVYEESVLYLDTINNAYDISQAYINMGNVFVHLGSYDRALEYFERALEISNKGNFQKNISLCLSNSGVVQNKCNNFEEAHKLYQRALTVSESLKDRILVSNCLINIGTNAADMGDFEAGLEYVQRGMEIKIELEDERAISNCHIHLAEIHTMMNESDTAIALFNIAIPVKNELGDQEGLVRCYLGLGSAFLQNQQYEEAHRLIDVALEIADTINALEHLATGYELNRQIAVALGDYHSAYFNSMQHHKYSDSLLNEATSRAVMEIEFRNRSMVLEQENENLRIQSALSDAFMAKRNSFMYSVMGIALLLAAGLVLVAYFLRRLRNSSLKLEEKNLVITTQNMKLDTLNKNKDQMMSIIAHDLRGTIGNQLTAIEVLHRIDGAKQKEIDRNKLLGNLKHSASYSLELLENLLHWSRLKENESYFHPEEVKIVTLITNCVTLFDETAKNKGITFKLKTDEPLVCFVDRTMMEIMLRNLISNSIKFSNPGGQISIYTEKKGDSIYIRINDSGIGMTEEQIHKILNNGGFTRRGTANEKGAGIGLTLVREFTSLHKGKLKVTSEPNEGSCFELKIPCITNQGG